MRYFIQMYDLIGREIELMTNVVMDMSSSVYKKAKWRVVEAYPHHVVAERVCENGAVIRESFDVGTLIQTGVIE